MYTGVSIHLIKYGEQKKKNYIKTHDLVFQNKHRDTLALLHELQSGLGSVNDTDDGKPCHFLTPAC
jgi:hypothetical protein